MNGSYCEIDRLETWVDDGSQPIRIVTVVSLRFGTDSGNIDSILDFANEFARAYEAGGVPVRFFVRDRYRGYDTFVHEWHLR